MPSGFRIEKLSVTGPSKTDAEVSFVDGLNVIFGASDTGKSYILKCIDYCFGAKEQPKPITESNGYTTVTLTLQKRSNSERLEIIRGLSGGDVRVRTYSGTELLTEEDISAVHSSKNSKNLSQKLLEMVGLSGTTVIKNKRGDRKNLSFRNIAHLTVVDEERIISERPPHQSGLPQDKTFETCLLRYILTGDDASDVIVAEAKEAALGGEYKIELLDEFISDLEAALTSNQVSDEEVTLQLESINSSVDEAFQSYGEIRNSIAELESRRTRIATDLSQNKSRLTVVSGLMLRFELLSRHYESDLKRLEVVSEAGQLLEHFPPERCVFCGALPEAQSPNMVDHAIDVEALRKSARAERDKIESLRRDLGEKIGELARESDELRVAVTEAEEAVAEAEAAVSSELRPAMTATEERLRELVSRRDSLLKAQGDWERLKAYRVQRSALIEQLTPNSPSTKTEKVPTKVTVGEADDFTEMIQSVLQSWNYPEAGKVLYSEKDQDIVIGRQARKAHGKGVRAITCSGFLYGLMRYCADKDRPHPRVLILDSPLVSYREPVNGQPSESGESAEISEDAALQAAGVKDAFYRALQSNAHDCQVIVLENRDPPNDIEAERITVFTKTAQGRYGFFPIPAEQ